MMNYRPASSGQSRNGFTLVEMMMAITIAYALLADFLFQRPPGLWAALVVLAAEALKARAVGLRDLPFPVEWVSVGTTLVGITLAYRLVLAVLLEPQLV